MKLGLEAGIVERHDARAERLVGPAHEFSTRRRDGHPRRTQFRIEPVDLRRRRDGEAPGELAEGRIVACLGVEMLHLDAAEARRKAHQVGEAQLRSDA